MSIQQIINRFTSDVLFECEVPECIESGFAMRYAAERAAKDMADLSDADLRDADLSGADLSGADLRGADLSRADLRDADLSGADLSGADLRGANLRGANLSMAGLRGADLSRADLSRADLRGADLRGANLRYANLNCANLSCANLSGANLSGANLSGADTSTDEQSIENLDKVRAIILDDSVRLEMGHWHGDDGEWMNKTCAEEAVCGTTHCLAGWLQVCATDPEVRAMDTQLAGIVQAPVAAKMFFRKSDEVLAWLTDQKYVSDIEESNCQAAERAARKSGGAA